MSLHEILSQVSNEKHESVVKQLIHFLDAEEILLSFGMNDRSLQKEEAIALVRQIVVELGVITDGVLDSDVLYDISESSEMWRCELSDWLDRHPLSTEQVDTTL